jgi:hypothetical protein
LAFMCPRNTFTGTLKGTELIAFWACAVYW